GLRLLTNCNGWSNSAVRNTVVPRQKNLKPRNCGRRRRLKRPHRPNPRPQRGVRPCHLVIAAGAGGSSARTGLTPGRNEGFALATLLTALIGSRKPRPPGPRAGVEGLTNYHSRR